MILDITLKELIPDCQIEYYNSAADLAIALENDKIDAYAEDQPIARYLTNKYPNHSITTSFLDYDYGYIFPKDNEKSEKLCKELNEYLSKIKADGTLEEIDGVWFGTDESVQKIDFESLSDENGTVNFAISSDVGAPFVYVKDGKYAAMMLT